jgi:hypothetical protein
MPDEKPARAYEVLMLEGDDGNARLYRHCGIVNAGDAGAAIAAIVGSHPYEGRYVAVPQTNWNERQVMIEQVPQVTVTSVEPAARQ